MTMASTAARLRQWAGPWGFRFGVAAILVVFFSMQIMDWDSAKKTPPLTQKEKRGTQHPHVISTNSSVILASTTMDLAPGELPGYTGWARSERTLAGYFQITSSSSNLRPKVGEVFSVTVQCQNEDVCSKGHSMFFLRAYGPSIISGEAVKVKGSSSYNLRFQFLDSGVYTVEAVVSFSNAPSFDTFPLAENRIPPDYEGYLLPGFPLIVTVPPISKNEPDPSQTRWCSFDELTESSTNSTLQKARWKVTSKLNGIGYKGSSSPQPISDMGYKQTIHSLGIQMAYKYFSGCAILPRAAYAKRQGNNNPLSKCSKQEGSLPPQNLQVIFIGDSVMRLQKDTFEEYVGHMKNVKVSFVELYGGYRRCEKKGTDIQAHFNDIMRRQPNDLKVVLFNTGLHDIHRLCGQEFQKDRYEYLNHDQLDAKTFTCTKEYEAIMEDFVAMVKRFPADLRIFQSTTAGWPKYGNFGVDWPTNNGQSLPLAPDTVSRFNDIAYGVLSKHRGDIHIMDGFWITYARPDNREIGSTGKKLSHPGFEVLSFMTRIWSQLIVTKVCNFS
jgi:hypothetical protein